MNIMIALFDDEQIQRSFIRSLRHEYESAGMEKGAEKEKKETILRMLKKSKLSNEDIADFVGVPEKMVNELAQTLQ